MSSSDEIRKVIKEELSIHLEDHRDLRSQIPSLVLIYPLDQHRLQSAFVSQKWMLKLCCMAPGEEHSLEGAEYGGVNKTDPARGVYQLESLGEYAGPIIERMKGKEKIGSAICSRNTKLRK